MNKQIHLRWSVTVIISFLLTLNFGCGGGGGGGGDATPPPPSVQSGVFIDGPVDGLFLYQN